MSDIVVTRRWPQAVESVLANEFNALLNTEDEAYDKEQLIEAVSEIRVLCPTVTDVIDADVIGAANNLQLIANFGVGYNHIDLAAAQAHGIVVTNTPGVLTDATADLAMTLLLMSARRAGEGERELRAGAWEGWRPTHGMGREVTGKTIGIVGAGRIGLATARRAHYGFGMRVLLCGRSKPKNVDFPAEWCAMDSLLEQADFVSLHCPSTPDTKHLIDAAALARMGPDSILINTARGDVVDEAALVQALNKGTIGGAALDVYEREPDLAEGLLSCPNTVLLPHLGSATVETRTAMGMCVIDNVRAFLAGREPPNPV